MRDIGLFSRCMIRAFVVFVLLGGAVVSNAQLPLATIPDWLRPAQRNVEVLSQTHVTLTGDNFRIIEPNVVARSKGFKLFGLITFRSASYTEAMTRLYQKANVEQGHSQALANVVHESASSYFVLFSIPKVTIRADLIEFEPADELIEDEEMAETSRVRGQERRRGR